MAYCSAAPCKPSVADSMNAPFNTPSLIFCVGLPSHLFTFGRPQRPPPKPPTALAVISAAIARGLSIASRPTLL